MAKHVILLLPLLALVAGCGGPSDGGDSAPPVIVHVAPAAAGLADGSSWANATTLAAALSTAPSGAQLWLLQGTYLPTAISDRTQSFAVTRQLGLYGGFTGIETALGDRDLSLYRSILSGEIGTAIATDNSYIVVGITGTGVVLDGLEVAAACGDASNHGAGIAVAASAGSISLRNVVVRDCSNPATTSAGAGLVVISGTSVGIRDCVFANNAVGSGDGGGLWLGPGSYASLVNCLFVGDTASGSGAAIMASNASLALTNCTIYNCDNASNGPVHLAASTAQTMQATNCVFDQNSGSAANGSVSMTGSIAAYAFTSNRLDGTNAWTTPLGSNITTAVSYVNSGSPTGADALYGTTDDGLRLAPASAGVSTGVGGTGIPSSDLSGLPRNTWVDLGAYDQPSGG